MNRRRILRVAATTSILGTAGCGSRQTETTTALTAATTEPTDGPHTDATTHATTSPSNRETIFVASTGDEQNPGTEQEPVASIQTAIDRAKPGETVHVLPGTYHESVRTKRPGEPDAPITITGPPEAVIHGDSSAEWTGGIELWHSHVHIRGLTFDGLQAPSEPGRPASYMQSAIRTLPVDHQYLRDLTIKPHAVGNTRYHCISLDYVAGAEVGEFRVIGPAGLEYELSDEFGHNAEIVYVGNPLGFEYSGWDLVGKGELGEMDETTDVHVHHIDNSAGHAHAELVDAKAGTSNIGIEYCTDAGGAGAYPLTAHHPETSEAAISLAGTDSVLRWCDISNAHGQGVEIGAWYLTHPDEVPGDIPDAAMDEGRGHSVYGNRLVDNGGLAIEYRQTEDGTIPEKYGPAAQRHICGNTYNGATHGSPDEPCPDDVPEGDGLGHTGDDSPLI